LASYVGTRKDSQEIEEITAKFKIYKFF